MLTMATVEVETLRLPATVGCCQCHWTVTDEGDGGGGGGKGVGVAGRGDASTATVAAVCVG